MVERTDADASSDRHSTVVLETIELVKTHQRGRLSATSLAGLSLSIRSGEFVVVMGPSGSGKSTLLQLLGLLDQPTSGRVLFRGEDVGHLSDKQKSLWRRDRIGFVFQFFHLLPTLTAQANVTVPMLLAGRRRQAAEQRAAELLTWVGLERRRRHRPSEMSGGEMQRAAIARALSNDPELILCDEPTGNLDTAGGKEVLELLRRLKEERRRTIVMVTHDLRAAQYGDRLVRLKDGRIESEEAIVSPYGDAFSAA